jgi:uncharacterized membrane protein
MRTKTVIKMRAAARVVLGAALAFAGISHLTVKRHEFRAQVPDWVPLPVDDTVVYSGIAEVALGSALVFAPKRYRPLVGGIAAAFFVAVFPGNIAQYVHKRDAFGLDTDQKRFVRLFFQPALVAWAIWSTRKAHNASAELHH